MVESFAYFHDSIAVAKVRPHLTHNKPEVHRDLKFCMCTIASSNIFQKFGYVLMTLFVGSDIIAD